MINSKAFSKAVNFTGLKTIFVALIVTIVFWYLFDTNSYLVILPIISTIITLIFMYLITVQTIKTYNDYKFLNHNLSNGTHKYSLKESGSYGNRYRTKWDKTDLNKIVISVLHGQLDGLYEEYDNKGNIEHRGNYNNGSQHGLWKYYKNGDFKNENKYHLGTRVIQMSELKKNTNSDDKELIDKKLLSISDGKRTEYYNSGSIRMINSNDTYSFYSKNELNDSIKKCEIIIEIDKALDYRNNFLHAFEPVLKGIWSNFRNDGSLDYQIDFSGYTNTNKKCHKISYDLLGNEISSKLKSVKFIDESIMLFHSYYETDRLIAKEYKSFNHGVGNYGSWVVDEKIKYFHKYETGCRGGPGASQSKVVINPVLDIDDVIELK